MSAQVSIIMPAYNPGRFIEPAIRSVMAQTYPDWELLVVDDGSSRDLSYLAKLDPRVRCIRQTNAGPAAARNRGMAESTAPYIAFLDADDLWLATKLRKQIEAMQADEQIGLSYTQFEKISADDQPLGTGFAAGVDSYCRLLTGSVILTSSTVIRRSCYEAVGGFDPQFRGPEDWDFFLSVVRKFKPRFLDEKLVQYRIIPGSLSRQGYPVYRQAREVLKKHLRLSAADKDQAAVAAARQGMRLLRRSHVCLEIDQAKSLRRAGRNLECARKLSIALRLEPIWTARSMALFFLPGLRGRSGAASLE